MGTGGILFKSLPDFLQNSINGNQNFLMLLQHTLHSETLD